MTGPVVERISESGWREEETSCNRMNEIVFLMQFQRFFIPTDLSNLLFGLLSLFYTPFLDFFVFDIISDFSVFNLFRFQVRSQLYLLDVFLSPRLNALF